ncbi:hypothetical protein DUNSADRAFT_9062 [Dunaliella salina]|uniref:Encoded protein n=1 Tax=Dunaliella salina TaxID=3046 RepID=A0ABQ7GI71_DUNSA|nr:hypothetical protein DUNSADRAFT_9062 [Dunaliella salina]|eukprot:KAF5834319.1 hypothetical protein DUNSADRAFT_9062 [Dunaliella salina]
MDYRCCTLCQIRTPRQDELKPQPERCIPDGQPLSAFMEQHTPPLSEPWIERVRAAEQSGAAISVCCGPSKRASCWIKLKRAAPKAPSLPASSPSLPASPISPAKHKQPAIASPDGDLRNPRKQARASGEGSHTEGSEGRPRTRNFSPTSHSPTPYGATPQSLSLASPAST